MKMQRSIAVAIGFAVLQYAHAASGWTHSWDSVSSMLWADFAGTDYSKTLTDEQIAFVANTYNIISLEKCFAMGDYNSTEAAVSATAARIKAVNPNTRVLFYYHSTMDFSDCYAAGKVFNAHPEWRLLDDYGNAICDGSGRCLRDSTQAAVRQYFIDSVLNASALGAAGLLDGIFADGAGGTSIANISASRTAEFWQSVYWQLGNTTVAMNQPGSGYGPGAQALANGLGLYPNNPPDHGVSMLPWVQGACFEHWNAFEVLDAKNGSLIPALFDTSLQLVSNASALGKTVIVKTWPGPATTPILPLGPAYPSNYPTPQNYTARAAAAAQYLEPVLASFLLVVQPNVWLSYSTWYTAPDGYYPCADAPDTCSTPSAWYPAFANRLGPPTGPAQRVPGGSGWLYTRSFQYATVSFDAVDWLNGSITWS